MGEKPVGKKYNMGEKPVDQTYMDEMSVGEKCMG